MATVSLPPESAAPLQTQASAPAVVRIEPPRGWLELRLAEGLGDRGLLYFFSMRGIQIRFQQTAIVGFWVVLTLAFGIHPPTTVLLLPVLIVLAVLTALGVGLWTSALNALYRDVRAVMPFVVQFWMLASPVAYPSSLVPTRWRWLYGLNPMAGVIDGFRWALTGHGQPPGIAMPASPAGGGVVLIGGLFFFQRMETNIADRV